jgi:hypothetical protein
MRLSENQRNIGMVVTHETFVCDAARGSFAFDYMDTMPSVPTVQAGTLLLPTISQLKLFQPSSS